MSHPVRGAWIEIHCGARMDGGTNESHPVRGAWMEIHQFQDLRRQISSHPVRGAWIEIKFPTPLELWLHRRTPSGVRGLKFGEGNGSGLDERRTPSGVRGLKFVGLINCGGYLTSHPVRGAWIEIRC